MGHDRIRPSVWLAGLLIAGVTCVMLVLVPRIVARRHKAYATVASASEMGEPSTPRLSQTVAGLPNTLEGLIDHYVASAGDPPARAAALDAILREPDRERRLFALLTAVARDPTRPETDPLWPRAIEGLSQLWEAGMARQGLDLMVMEARPRARQALASSFAHLVTSTGPGTLPAVERTVLANDFIDLYQQFPGMQRTEMQQTLQALGHGDAADILQGKGLASDDELATNRAYEHAIARTLHPSTRP